MTTTTKAAKLASVASVIATTCEALRNCEATPDHPWTSRWASLLDAIEANLLPSGGGFDRGTQIDREATNARRISLRVDFHHTSQLDTGFYSGWTSHRVTISPTFSGCEISVSGSDLNQVREHIVDVFGSIFHHSNQIAYTFDDRGGVDLIAPDAL